MNLPSKIRIYSKAWFAFYNKDRHPEIRQEVCDHSTIWALEKQTFTPKQLGAIKMAIQISTSNEVILDQQHTGFHVKQGDTHTRLVNKSGEEISLPNKRYSLVSNNPGGDAQGLDQFEIDFKAATGA